jgi:single-stranded-DNA-specific exonuclease
MASIHPKVLEYAQKFNLTSTKDHTFFTHFDSETALSQLPYFHEIIPAVLRINEAITARQKICVYCDYDTDAVTAGATMYWGLQLLGCAPNMVTFYTPDRFTEGYGINKDAFVALAQCNDLIISVDCGINSVKEVEAVKQFDCDVVITDHHKLTGVIPDAYSVVNPQIASHPEQLKQRQGNWNSVWSANKNHDSLTSITNTNAASQSITGVGVAWFVLVWLGYVRNTINSHEDIKITSLNLLLPYVAIGTIADCQSILDITNRMLVKGGLLFLQKGKYIGTGLKELIKQTGFEEKMRSGYVIGSQDLGFVFSPILNASGRMTHASHSLALVTYNNGSVPISEVFQNRYTGYSCQQLASELITINNERKKMVQSITSEVDDQVNDQISAGKPIVWIQGEWSKGIIGLIASRIVSRVHKPVAVFSTIDSDHLVASLRAPKGYDLAEAISHVQDIIIAGGGHPGAAGLSVAGEHYELLRSRLSLEISKAGEVNANTNSLPIDLKNSVFSDHPDIISSIHDEFLIVLDDDSELPDVLESLPLLEPFGQHFLPPKLLVRSLVTNIRTIGKDSNHIKGYTQGISITQFYSSPETLAFVTNNTAPEVEMTLLLKHSFNTWNGSTKVEGIIDRMWIEDIAVSSMVS